MLPKTCNNHHQLIITNGFRSVGRHLWSGTDSLFTLYLSDRYKNYLLVVSSNDLPLEGYLGYSKKSKNRIENLFKDNKKHP